MPSANRLNAQDLIDAKPQGKPYKLADGIGMFLLVNPNGGKYWRFKYRFAGKEKQLSLGVYPATSLDAARELRRAFREMLADGTDPGEQRKRTQAVRREAAGSRFLIDNHGALTFRFGSRRVSLTAEETGELRHFLDATRQVTPKEKPCP